MECGLKTGAFEGFYESFRMQISDCFIADDCDAETIDSGVAHGLASLSEQARCDENLIGSVCKIDVNGWHVRSMKQVLRMSRQLMDSGGGSFCLIEKDAEAEVHESANKFHCLSTVDTVANARRNGTKILDLTHHKDRENHWNFFGYNSLRERVATVDPLNRTTRLIWCYCGALQDLYDAEGNHTHWDYDIGGRLLCKTYADGTQHNHSYDLAGRPSTTTDAKGQIKTHSYHRDGQLAGIAYTNSQHPTANISFTYDAIYGRLAQMTDGTGSTSYSYHPVNGSTFGAGNLHTIDGPLTNDTIAHTYDALGRPKTRSINGSANTTTVDTYDALGRVTQLTNPLGSFTHSYDPVSLLPKTVTAPNGLSTTFDYETA
ncbi:MAG: hypothetical protein RLZZ245_2001, partial [Verrucomicrobiota bacterium]